MPLDCNKNRLYLRDKVQALVFVFLTYALVSLLWYGLNAIFNLGKMAGCTL